MRHWKCKCGKCEAFGSDAPWPCESCEHCGTNFSKQEPEPHEMKPVFSRSTGEFEYNECSKCRIRDAKGI